MGAREIMSTGGRTGSYIDFLGTPWIRHRNQQGRWDRRLDEWISKTVLSKDMCLIMHLITACCLSKHLYHMDCLFLFRLTCGCCCRSQVVGISLQMQLNWDGTELIHNTPWRHRAPQWLWKGLSTWFCETHIPTVCVPLLIVGLADEDALPSLRRTIRVVLVRGIRETHESKASNAKEHWVISVVCLQPSSLPCSALWCRLGGIGWSRRTPREVVADVELRPWCLWRSGLQHACTHCR